MNKLKFLYAFFIALFFITPLSAYAQNCNISIEAPSETFNPNDQVIINFVMKNTDPSNSKNPFHCEINYDANNLKYNKVLCTINAKRNDIKLEKSTPNKLNIIYNPKESRNIIFENDKAQIFKLIFTVKNAVNTSTSSIHANFTDLNSGTPLSSQNCEIKIRENPEINNCKLTSLSPDFGQLSPEFNPDIFEYTTNVPSKIKNLHINASASKDNLEIKISRHKLAAAGKITTIKITVSDKKLKIKSTYTVMVHRDLKDPSNNSNPLSDTKANSSKTKKSKSKKPKSQKSISKQNQYDNSFENDDEENSIENSTQELPSHETYCEDKTNIFDNSKLYFVVTLITLGCGILGYFTVKFIKSKKYFFKKIYNSLNKTFKK